MAGCDHAEVPSGERPLGSSPVAGPSRTVSLPEDALALLATQPCWNWRGSPAVSGDSHGGIALSCHRSARADPGGVDHPGGRGRARGRVALCTAGDRFRTRFTSEPLRRGARGRALRIGSSLPVPVFGGSGGEGMPLPPRASYVALEFGF